MNEYEYTSDYSSVNEQTDSPAAYDYTAGNGYGTGNGPENNSGKKHRGKGRKFALTALLMAFVIAVGGLAGTAAYYFAGVHDSVVKAAVTGTGSRNSSGVEQLTLRTSDRTVLKDVESTGDAVVVRDVSDVVEEAMPCIVSVYNNFTQSVNWFGRTYVQEGQGIGSGIIVGESDDELLIVTNYHVINGEESLEVKFIDDTNAAAVLKGTDPDNDLAVIVVKKADLTQETIDAINVAVLGDSDALRIGEPAIAIGNALGYGQSVTVGVISALNRSLPDDDGGDRLFIQTDAAINQGNSGGALLNIAGEVIGINSNKIGGAAVDSMGFAIPMSTAAPIIQELMNYETRDKVEEENRGALGIRGVSVTADVAEAYGMPKGAYVAMVLDDTGAENSGLQKGDIITKLGGVRIMTMNDLQNRLEYYSSGEKVTVTVQRPAGQGEYEEVEVEVTLGAKKNLDTGSEQQQPQQQEEPQGEQQEDNPFFPGFGGFRFNFGF